MASEPPHCICSCRPFYPPTSTTTSLRCIASVSVYSSFLPLPFPLASSCLCCSIRFPLVNRIFLYTLSCFVRLPSPRDLCTLLQSTEATPRVSSVTVGTSSCTYWPFGIQALLVAGTSQMVPRTVTRLAELSDLSGDLIWIHGKADYRRLRPGFRWCPRFNHRI